MKLVRSAVQTEILSILAILLKNNPNLLVVRADIVIILLLIETIEIMYL